MNNTKPTLAIIDGFSFLFRAFYGVRHLSTSTGLPTNALYGFSQMLIKVAKDIQPHCCVVALEGKGANFRNDLYPDYKANRAETPELLAPQIPLLEPLIQSFDIPAIHEPTFEADDVIATLAKQYKATHNVVIISSDKDLMQLIDDNVSMLDTMKSKEIRAPEVFEKFGVTPDKVTEVQALIGDTSDNIPGVPSIGPKTAAELIQAYGDLETLYDNLENIKQQKRREKLADNKELVFLSRQLVTLNQDLPLNLSSDELRFHPTLDAAANFLTTKLEFNTLADRLVKGNHFIRNDGEGETAPAASQKEEMEYNTHPFSRYSTNIEASKAENAKPAPQAAAAPAPQKTSYVTITDEKTLDQWVTDIRAAGRFAFDTETTSLTAATAELVGISLAHTAGQAAYIPLTHKSAASDGFDFGDAPSASPDQLPTALVLEKLKPLFEDAAITKIAQNLKYDWQIIYNAMAQAQPDAMQQGLRPSHPTPSSFPTAGGGSASYSFLTKDTREAFHNIIQNYEDTMLMSFCLNGGKHGHGMDDLSKKYLGVTPISFKEVCGIGKSQITFDYVGIDKATSYAAEDADITLRLYELFAAQISQADKDDVRSLYENVERPLVPILAAMEHTGVAIDKAALARLSLQLQTEIEGLEKEIHALAGEPFNIASPKQLGNILFDKLELPSKSKKRSTNVEVLEGLSDQGHDIADKVLAFRSASKLKSTYADALAEKINAISGRIHTHYHQSGASTGRFSSSDPNLQNIPARTEQGRLIRKAFVATRPNASPQAQPDGSQQGAIANAAPSNPTPSSYPTAGGDQPTAGSANQSWWIASLDYSQIELRLLAHFSKSEPLIEAFKAGKDVHARTGELIFSEETELEPSEQRRVAKIINFGIVYGMGPVNLAKQTGFSRAEATQFIERYFERYTGVREYMQRNKEFALINGYVSTLMGRRVHLPDINSPNGMLKSGAERAAINAPLQGSNADVIKKAMIDIQEFLIQNNKETRMLMQVHDELIFEGPESEKEILGDLSRLMEEAVTLAVPLKVDGGAGNNWGELK